MTGTNKAGQRPLTLGSYSTTHVGYVVARIITVGDVINCYIESTLDLTTGCEYPITDESKIDKTRTYNEFKTLLGWDNNIWHIPQSQYQYPV